MTDPWARDQIAALGLAPPVPEPVPGRWLDSGAAVLRTLHGALATGRPADWQKGGEITGLYHHGHATITPTGSVPIPVTHVLCPRPMDGTAARLAALPEADRDLLALRLELRRRTGDES